MGSVLGLIGSPRKRGNTDLLVTRMLDGAASGGAATGSVFLCDLKIEECDGCHVCWEGKPCARQDDMNDLYGRVIAADTLVFGTPVYWYGPTALMKLFVDRLVYFNSPQNRAQIRGKRAILAIPYEDEGSQTGELVVDFFQRCFDYLEMELSGAVVVGGVGNRGDVLRRQDCLDAAYALGREVADCGNDGC